MPERVTMTTFKRADGEPIDEYGWVTDLEAIDRYDLNEPLSLIREEWERVAVQTVVMTPARWEELEEEEPHA